MGAEAVLALMEAGPSTAPCVIAIDGNQIVRVPLKEAVLRVCLFLFLHPSLLPLSFLIHPSVLYIYNSLSPSLLA